MIHGTEKSIKDLGDKVEADEKAAAETAIVELKAALEGDDKAVIEAKTEALTEAAGKIAEKAYAEQQGAAEGAQPESGQGEAAMLSMLSLKKLRIARTTNNFIN